MGIFSFFTKTPTPTTEKKDLTSLFSKETLIDILDSSSSMMMIFTSKEGWVEANKSFLNIIGYESIHDFRRQHDSIRDLFLVESEEIFTQNDKTWLDYIKKHKKDGYHVKLYDANNDILDISLRCTNPKNSNGIYILEFENVTSLYLAKNQVQGIEKLKTKLLSNIGHEFRTPMNGIIGFIDLLSQTSLDKTQDEYVNLIEHSSRSLMSNIETLLDLSQLQGGRLTLDNSSFELIPHIEELIYNNIVVAKERGIKVFSFIDPKLPKELNSDIRKIKQIMNSLIQNAIKFTQRAGKIIVEVKLLKRQINGECSIGFSVKDNGKGISKKDIKYIVEPFNSGNHTDHKLGVGLSLSNGLINLLGSDLHIQSEEGNGSYFNFVLNFNSSKGQSYKMMPKKKVKVLLLDKTKINEANFLSAYLRSFAIDVIKTNTLDDKIYDDIESLYIVANQHDSSWMFKLGTLGKKVPVTMLLEEEETLQTKLTHVVDSTISLPIFPSVISKHLEELHNTNLSVKEKIKPDTTKEVRALVVEDNLINQKLMQIMLREYGVSVSIASNGNEAVEICEKNNFDIIFMDIDMPEKNGIVATQEIKSKIDVNKHTPIIAFTALAMQGDKEKLLNEGLDDYLSKPLTRDKLEKLLNKYLKALLV